ncbi:MAG: zinc-ribbon domain containing protein [Desulfosporosinus sp.]|nr:zinc-ribbon domain containing protein [Desulfosporosinus sp.]
MFTDKVLTCRDCGREFLFSASEQDFFAEKGFTNEPRSCPECRAAKKAQNRPSDGYNNNRSERRMFPAICAECGKETAVPFQPSGDKPVYCRECFHPTPHNKW